MEAHYGFYHIHRFCFFALTMKGFVKIPAQIQTNWENHQTDDERNTPAKIRHLLIGQNKRQTVTNQTCRNRSQALSHHLPTCVAATFMRRCCFKDIGRSWTRLSSPCQALH
ncbi:hypothetical protein D3C85_1492930 [compost metagenome]